MSCKPLSEEMKQWVHDNWPDNEAAATPTHVLRTQVMDPRIPKNEREWWASRRITELEKVAEAANNLSIYHPDFSELSAALREAGYGGGE